MLDFPWVLEEEISQKEIAPEPTSKMPLQDSNLKRLAARIVFKSP